MIRVLVPEESLVAGARLTLAPEEVHHLQVRRVADGTGAIALDGVGEVGEGSLFQEGKTWIFAVDRVSTRPPPALTMLVVGAGDRDRFVTMVEKATEIGVSLILPLESERALQVATRLRMGSIDKARRAAAEASKQSGNPWVPMVADPISFDGFLGLAPAMQWRLADQSGGPCGSIGSLEQVGWLIGPEGGFTEVERSALSGQLNPVAVSLGDHLLRFETAAIAAAMLTADRRRRG